MVVSTPLGLRRVSLYFDIVQSVGLNSQLTCFFFNYHDYNIVCVTSGGFAVNSAIYMEPAFSDANLLPPGVLRVSGINPLTGIFLS